MIPLNQPKIGINPPRYRGVPGLAPTVNHTVHLTFMDESLPFVGLSDPMRTLRPACSNIRGLIIRVGRTPQAEPTAAGTPYNGMAENILWMKQIPAARKPFLRSSQLFYSWDSHYCSRPVAAAPLMARLTMASTAPAIRRPWPGTHQRPERITQVIASTSALNREDISSPSGKASAWEMSPAIR